MSRHGAGSSHEVVCENLGLPPSLAVGSGRRPEVVCARFDTLKEGGNARVILCDRCSHTFTGISADGFGTFLFDRFNRHMWCLDHVKPVYSSAGACIRLMRPSDMAEL